MQTPKFWKIRGFLSYLILPLSFIYSIGFKLKKFFTSTKKVKDIIVICVGNVAVGGAGKTPIAIEISEKISTRFPDKKICFLTRGYKSKISGVTIIEKYEQRADIYGDEAILLANHFPVIISKNRYLGAELAKEKKFDIVIMDDGYQNFILEKDINILVIDGKYKFGNGFLLPAGPLRESKSSAFARADFIIMVNNKENNYYSAKTDIVNKDELDGKRVLAFSGLAHNQKFFESLKEIGVKLEETYEFPDHYAYKDSDIVHLINRAKYKNLDLITTEKDIVKINNELRQEILVAKLNVEIEGKFFDALYKKMVL